MLMRDKIAGILVAVGALALVLAPMEAVKVGQVANAAEPNQVAVAIASGSQLRLVRNKPDRNAVRASEKADRQMICDNVFQLPIAQIGLQCRALPAVLASASR